MKNTMTHHMQRFLGLCLVGLLGCGKCGSSGARLVEADFVRYLPQDASMVILVPQVGKLGEKVKILENLKAATFAAQLNGFGSANEFASSLMGQLGVDLRSKEALGQAGLSFNSGIAVITREDSLYAFVQVAEESRFRKFVSSMAKTRMGSQVASEKNENGLLVTTFASPQRGSDFVFAVRNGLAVLAFGKNAPQPQTIFALPAEKSLQTEGRFRDVAKQLGSEYELLLYIPTQMAAQEKLRTYAGLGVILHLSESALTLLADKPSTPLLNEEKSDDLKPIPWESLPTDAFLVASVNGNPQSLADALREVGGDRLESVLRDAQVDLQEEVFSNLEPGLVATLSLAPGIRFDRGMPAMNPQVTNPFRFVQLLIHASVKDAEKAKLSMEKLPQFATQLGAAIEKKEEEGLVHYETFYAQGEGVHFALVGTHLLAASPLKRLRETRSLLMSEKPGPGPMNSKNVRNALKEGTLSVAVDLQRLSQAIRELPTGAWGIGGFAIKATTLRWLDATSDLQTITFNVRENDKSIRSELTLRLGAP